MKVLVTGATGFIGNYVVRELLSRGIQVIASARQETTAQAYDWFGEVDFVPYDLHQPRTELQHYFHQPGALIHLAWQGLPNYKNRFHIEEELMAQYQFVKQLIEGGLSNITITGTCFEYGKREGCLSENDMAIPENPYAIAKDSLRKFISVLQADYSFAFKWLRLFYMYGKGQSPNSILPQLQRSIDEGQTVFNMSKGDQVRDYLPVEQVASHIVDCALQQAVQGVINVSSNRPIQVKELVEKYLSETKQTISLNLGFYPYPDYEPFAFWGDNSKLTACIYESNRSI